MSEVVGKELLPTGERRASLTIASLLSDFVKSRKLETVFSEHHEDGLGMAVAKALGIKVDDSMVLSASSYVCLTINGRNSVTVHIPKETPAPRRNFLVAMALGRYVLHYIYGQWHPSSLNERFFATTGRDTGSLRGAAYAESLMFARALTVPPTLFAQRYHRNPSLLHMARWFCVMPMVVSYRRKEYLQEKRKPKSPPTPA